MAKFGGLQEHRAMVVTSPKTQNEGNAYAAAVRPLFDGVRTFILPTDPVPGWPRSCNEYFKQAAVNQEWQGNKEPWMWFEADMTPLKPGWVNELICEYNLQGKPFMGVRNQTWFTRQGVPYQDGHHMVGAGIYPPNLSHFSKAWQWAVDEPWDVFARWEIEPKMHATKLIQHNWGTGNYRRAGKGGTIIMCDQVQQPTKLAYNAAIRKETMVLHGCKDNSLRDLILEA